MRRSTQTALRGALVGICGDLARGQSLASLSPEITTEGAAAERKSIPPELTLEEAIAQAVANNSSLKTASLETHRAADDLAANRTRRFANTQIIALGAQLVTKPSVTYPAGLARDVQRDRADSGNESKDRDPAKTRRHIVCARSSSRFRRSTSCTCN